MGKHRTFAEKYLPFFKKPPPEEYSSDEEENQLLDEPAGTTTGTTTGTTATDSDGDFFDDDEVVAQPRAPIDPRAGRLINIFHRDPNPPSLDAGFAHSGRTVGHPAREAMARGEFGVDIARAHQPGVEVYGDPRDPTRMVYTREELAQLARNPSPRHWLSQSMRGPAAVNVPPPPPSIAPQRPGALQPPQSSFAPLNPQPFPPQPPRLAASLRPGDFDTSDGDAGVAAFRQAARQDVAAASGDDTWNMDDEELNLVATELENTPDRSAEDEALLQRVRARQSSNSERYLSTQARIQGAAASPLTSSTRDLPVGSGAPLGTDATVPSAPSVLPPPSTSATAPPALRDMRPGGQPWTWAPPAAVAPIEAAPDGSISASPGDLDEFDVDDRDPATIEADRQANLDAEAARQQAELAARPPHPFRPSPYSQQVAAEAAARRGQNPAERRFSPFPDTFGRITAPAPTWGQQLAQRFHDWHPFAAIRGRSVLDEGLQLEDIGEPYGLDIEPTYPVSRRAGAASNTPAPDATLVDPLTAARDYAPLGGSYPNVAPGLNEFLGGRHQYLTPGLRGPSHVPPGYKGTGNTFYYMNADESLGQDEEQYETSMSAYGNTDAQGNRTDLPPEEPPLPEPFPRTNFTRRSSVPQITPEPLVPNVNLRRPSVPAVRPPLVPAAAPAVAPQPAPAQASGASDEGGLAMLMAMGMMMNQNKAQPSGGASPARGASVYDNRQTPQAAQQAPMTSSADIQMPNMNPVDFQSGVGQLSDLSGQPIESLPDIDAFSYNRKQNSMFR